MFSYSWIICNCLFKWKNRLILVCVAIWFLLRDPYLIIGTAGHSSLRLQMILDWKWDVRGLTRESLNPMLSGWPSFWGNEPRYLCVHKGAVCLCNEHIKYHIFCMCSSVPATSLLDYFLFISNFFRKTLRRTSPPAPCHGSRATWRSCCTWFAVWNSCYPSSTYSARCSTARPAAARTLPTHATTQIPPSPPTRRTTNWRARKSSGVRLDRTSRRWWKKTF